MLSEPTTKTLYAGGTLALDLYADTTVADTGLDADCWIQSTFKVQYPDSATWYDSTDTSGRWARIVNSATAPTGTGKTYSITLIANVAEFGFGLSTDVTTLTLKFTYFMPGVSDEDTFELKILPTSALVQLCSSNTDTLISVADSITDFNYVVGGASHNVVPPTFSRVAASDSAYDNTALPIQNIFVILQFSTDNGSTWNMFPTDKDNVLFFSTKGDTSCVSSLTPSTYAFTISCSDNTKFAASGSTSVKLRYSA
jgi:hypothetical protein